MPIEDHPVHPSIVKTDPIYHACQNKVRLPGPMSMKCRYDRFHSDPGCQGCKQPKDVEFLKEKGII